MRVILGQQADMLVEYVHRIQFPVDINLTESPITPSLNTLDRLFKWVIDAVITVYARSERKNDFFILHGVTSAFAIRQINSFISEQSVPSNCSESISTDLDTLSITHLNEGALESVRTYLCTLLATYLTQGAPALLKQAPLDEGPQCSWAELKEKALVADCDEHIYKLFHICAELDAETSDIAVKDLYLEAVQTSLENKFFFHVQDEKTDKD